jgi:hypothetical protein
MGQFHVTIIERPLSEEPDAALACICVCVCTCDGAGGHPEPTVHSRPASEASRELTDGRERLSPLAG